MRYMYHIKHITLASYLKAILAKDFGEPLCMFAANVKSPMKCHVRDRYDK